MSATEAGREPDQRQEFLRRETELVGAVWVRGLCESMLAQGRCIEGGWPGTMPEARARVLGYLTPKLASRKMASLTHSELTRATTFAYDRARRDWIQAVRGVAAAERGGKSAEPSRVF